MECRQVYHQHSRAGPIPRNSWPTQNKLHIFYVGFFGVEFCFVLVMSDLCLIFIFLDVFRERKNKKLDEQGGGKVQRATGEGEIMIKM